MKPVARFCFLFTLATLGVGQQMQAQLVEDIQDAGRRSAEELRITAFYQLKKGDTLEARNTLLASVAAYRKLVQQEGQNNPTTLWDMAYAMELLAGATPDTTTQLTYKDEAITLRQASYTQAPDFDKQIVLAGCYGNLSWDKLLVGDFQGAEQAAQNGLNTSPDQAWIYTNLATALLYQGKWKEASRIYKALKRKTFDAYKGQSYGDIFLKDLDILEAAGFTHPDVAKARKLLSR